jgi:hypothetical protein
MQPIPTDILSQFATILKQRNIPVDAHNDYRKWLRYFLDFRAKYSPPDCGPIRYGYSPRSCGQRSRLLHNGSSKFQNYLKNKPPETLSPSEVKAYLTYLAVNYKMSSKRRRARLTFKAVRSSALFGFE